MTIYSHAGLNYIKPSELLKRHPDIQHTLEELQAIANQPDAICPNCENPVWKYGQCGMCFTCTTGEADGSDDYELLEEGVSKQAEPKLKKSFVAKGVWAVQIGRTAALRDDTGLPVPQITLGAIEAIRYQSFTDRLADAWKEYDKQLEEQ